MGSPEMRQVYLAFRPGPMLFPRIRSKYNCSTNRSLHQNQMAAQGTQLLLNFCVETRVANDGVDL